MRFYQVPPRYVTPPKRNQSLARCPIEGDRGTLFATRVPTPHVCMPQFQRLRNDQLATNMTLHRKPHGPSLLPSSPSTCSALHNGKNAYTKVPTDELRAILSTILPLLDAFNHRHRNQHRASFWWSTFGNFRRSLARLARALQHQVPDNKRHGIDHVSARVTWLNSHFLPRAFV